MGDAEGLVQVQVADIAAELARCGNADQRIHVRAVDIDPAAMLVHQCAQLLDLGLEHAMGAGVGDHHGRQIGAVFLALGLEVGHVDVAVVVTGGHYHRQAGHLGAGRVRAMRAGRDQADRAVGLTVRCVVGADRQQPGVFALAAGVGLKAHAGVTGGLAQPVAQLLVEFCVAQALVGRCERVDVGELRPGDRNHLAGGVELHRATAQRDHAAVQRQVLVGQAPDVTQHAGFAVMGVEHRMGQERAGAQQTGGQHGVHIRLELRNAGQHLAITGEHRPQAFELAAGGGLVERQADAVAR